MTRSTQLNPSAATIRGVRCRCFQLMHFGILSLGMFLGGCTTSFMPPFSMPQEPVPTHTAPAQSAQLKLGMLLSLSGSLAKYGSTMQDSVRLLMETVNDCGGVAGQAVQLFAEDDQSSVATGKVGIDQLIKTHRAQAIIGAIGSEVSNATATISASQQVVQISPASASPILTERAQKGDFRGFWFRTMPPDTFQGIALAQLAKQRGFKTVSILASDSAYGNSIVQAFSAYFEQTGGTINPPVRYSSTAGLYGVDWSAAFRGKPDAVLIVADPALGSELLKIAYESGDWNGSTKVLLTSSMKTENLAGKIGQSIDGRYIASGVLGVAPTVAANTAFPELYQKKFGHEPSLYDANTWDAAAVVTLAAEAAKTITGPAIKEKIFSAANPPGVAVSDVCQALALIRDGREIDYQGASGVVDFNKTGDVVGVYDVWTIDYTGAIKVEATIRAGAE